MPRGPIQRIQDCVHGLMEFKGMEAVVVDVLRTPEIQRLRRVRQLGLAHFVFPGAEHSRLVHSLGAAFLAIQFARTLQEACRGYLIDLLTPSDSAVRDLAVAVLCHDLGHGPLSHAWEREIIGKPFDFDKWVNALGLSAHRAAVAGLEWHELVAQSLLAWEDGQLHQLLQSHEGGFPERVQHLLRGQYYLPYLSRLISSDIDVDRADFVRRDAYQSGVAYGRYDLSWLISTCTVGETERRQLVVGFDRRKAPRVVEQFLIARRALYDTVYYHKTVRSAEGMLGLFLRRLKEVINENPKIEVAPFVQPMIRMVAGEALGPNELLSVDDYSLWILIDNVAKQRGMDPTVRDIGQRILARDLFKMVPCSHEKVNEFLRRHDSRERIYDAIQPYCPGKREYYLIEDTMKFSMLSAHEKAWGYFVDDSRKAIPIREEEPFRHFLGRTDETVRLFTLREAVEAVASLIG